jgi:serine/threonine-protein kinase
MPPPGAPGAGELGSLLDGRYRIELPVAEGILLRELRGRDEREGREISLWLPHRQVAPAFEDIEAEIAAVAEALPAGCRRVLDRGRQHAFVVGAVADHVGPRPRRQPHTRAVVAGWFRAVAGIIARNHQAGRWHGLLTCDDLAIADGRLVASGFGFWVRTDPEAIAAVLAEADAARLRELCAPEVLACAIGPAADLWALGRCTLALATGSGEADAMAALQDRHPPLARALAGLLHEDPEARPGDLRALAEAVTRALEQPYLDEIGRAHV